MAKGLLPLLALLGALTAPGISGCAPDLTCDEEISGGGDIVGPTDSNGDGILDSRWVVIDPCENIVSSPPTPVTLEAQPPHLSGSGPPKEASGDWCQNLSLNGDGMITRFNPWIPRLPLKQHASGSGQIWYDAYLTYGGDNNYSFGAVLYDTQTIDLPGRCLTQQGVALSCDQLAPLLTTEYNTTEARLGRTAGVVNVSNMLCVPSTASDGCACIFDMAVTYDPTTDPPTGPAGKWFTIGGLLTHFDLIGRGSPFQADYRVEGNTLSLAGYHRRALFGIMGMRTLKLARVVCNDGAQGPGEDGVDCGSNCPANPPCP